jgi:hypothetical protein
VDEVDEVFEDPPRGSLGSRMLGKLPAVGIVGGGFSDERKGIRKAAYRTAELLTDRSRCDGTVTRNWIDGLHKPPAG